MVDALGLGSDNSKNYDTAQNMYSEDKNNIKNDQNAVDYFNQLADRMDSEGDHTEADALRSATGGQKDVDFHGAKSKDQDAAKANAQQKADDKLSGNIDDTAKSLNAAKPGAGDDFKKCVENNDYRGAQDILKQVHGSNEANSKAGHAQLSNDDYNKGMQAMEAKSLVSDEQHHHGEVANDLKNFKKEGGSNDELASLVGEKGMSDTTVGLAIGFGG